MVRKLVRTLVSLSLATPLSVWGLGLGDIHLHSALNEKLNADIDLLSVEPGDLESIEVDLASYATFNRFGIERLGTLALLEFKVEKGPTGKPYIRVTSQQPIREPFLDFLIEVDWRNGKLLREYTLLLDPPSVTQAQAPAVAAPSAEPSKPAAVSTPAPAGAAGSDALVYGPVKNNDTLWSIAKRLRPDDTITIKQMMMALFEANPDAFLDNNINQLRKGAVLRLDDPAMARAISRARAAREVARQTQRWSATKAELAEEGASRSASPVPAAPGSSVAVREEAQLKLVTPEGDQPSPGVAAEGDEGGLENVRKELMLALEAAETQRQENEELRKRLQELEGQLASMQRLLSLKSDGMAQLQQQLSEGGPAEAAPLQAKPEGEGQVEPAQQPVQTAQAPQAEKPQPAPAQPKPEPKPKPQPAPKPEPVQVSLIDEVLSNPMMVGGLGLGVVLLGLLAIVIRRRMTGGGFQESILTGGTSSMLNPKGGTDSSMETSLLSDLADDGMGGMPAEDSEVDPITEADVYMAYGRHQQAEELLKDAIEQDPERHELLVKLMEIYYKTKNRKGFETQAGAAHAALEGSGPLWDKIAAMGHELAPDNPLFAEAPESPVPIAEEAEENVAAIDDVLDIGLDLDALAAEMEPAEEFGGEANASADDDELDLGVDLSDLETGAEATRTDGDPKKAAEGDTEAESVADELDDLDFGLDLDESTSEQDAENSGDGDLDALAGLEFETGGEGRETAAASEEAVGEDALEGLGLDFDTGESPEPSATGADDSNEEPLSGLDFASEGAPNATDEATPATSDEDLLADLDFDLATDAEDTSARLTDDEEAPADLDAAPAEAPSTSQDEETASDETGLEFNLDDFDLPGQEEESAPEVAAEADSADNGLDFDLGDFKLPGDEESESTEGAGAEIPAADLPVDSADQELEMSFGGEASDDSGDLDLDLGDDFGDALDEVGTKLDLATAYVEMGDAEGAREMLEEVLKEGDEQQKAKAKELIEKIAT